jgi:uncharacterized membrane protein
VATFVYDVLVLVSIGPGQDGEFVPHISVTATLALMVADLAVLIYFIHHTATSIQLPQVIASIAITCLRRSKCKIRRRCWRPGHRARSLRDTCSRPAA